MKSAVAGQMVQYSVILTEIKAPGQDRWSWWFQVKQILGTRSGLESNSGGKDSISLGSIGPPPAHHGTWRSPNNNCFSTTEYSTTYLSK
jgi:hypothetical protein